MYNPFDEIFLPEDYDLTLLDRVNDFDLLKTRCSGKRILNYRYISPRGTGKSTLLNAFFSPERCQELAKQHKLVHICSFSGDDMATNEAVLVRLIEAVKDSLWNLDEESRDFQRFSREFEKLEMKHPEYTKDADKGAALLKEMLRTLTRLHYSVTLVLDEFHQLACAKHLADATFSKMAALGQDKLISYILASDYEDSVGSTMYYISPFSRIFSGTNHLKGITSPEGQEALIRLLRDKLAPYRDIQFTDNEFLTIFTLTAGIPKLVQNTLKDLFEVKLNRKEELAAQDMEAYALSACSRLMGKWVQYWDDAKWETAQAVLADGRESAIQKVLPKDRDKLADLCEAGLLVRDPFYLRYQFICPLFVSYLQRELPRRNPESTALAVAQTESAVPQPVYPVQKPPVEAPEKKQIIIVSNGSTVVLHDGPGNLIMNSNHLHQGLSVSEIMTLLEAENADPRNLFATSLASRLKERIPAGSLPVLSPSDYETVDAYEDACDHAFSQFSGNVIEDVQVDEDQDIVMTPEEIQTLQSRFEDAKKRCRKNLTDELLATQSERCQFYLKLSVVVEDALALPGLQMDDYSPHLILYGKALEQTLRDHLYPLFHRENILSQGCFSINDPIRLNIIDYIRLISSENNHLSDLCQTHLIRKDNQPADTGDWSGWWNCLQADINDAREIRNLAGHATSKSPTKENLDKMCSLLFGENGTDGILARNVVGTQLNLKMFPPSISFEAIHKYVNQNCIITCDLVKRNGGIKGSIKGSTPGESYPVNISPNRVQKFRKENGLEQVDFTGKQLIVKVLEITKQDNAEFFAAELVSLVP